MAYFFAWNFAGHPFVLLGPAHLAALAAIVLLNLGLIRFKGSSEDTRRKVRWTLGNYAMGGGNFVEPVGLFQRPMDSPMDAATQPVHGAYLAHRFHADIQEQDDLRVLLLPGYRGSHPVPGNARSRHIRFPPLPLLPDLHFARPIANLRDLHDRGRGLSTELEISTSRVRDREPLHACDVLREPGAA